MHYWKQSQLAIVKESRGECFMSGHLRSTLGPCFCFYQNFDHWKTKDSSKFHICQNTVWGAPRQRQGDRGDSEFYYSHLRPRLVPVLLPLSWAGFSLCRNPVKLSAVTRPLLWSSARLRVTLRRKYIHTLSFTLHFARMNRVTRRILIHVCLTEASIFWRMSVYSCFPESALTLLLLRPLSPYWLSLVCDEWAQGPFWQVLLCSNFAPEEERTQSQRWF